MAYLRTFATLTCLVAAIAAVPTDAEACSPDPCYFDVTWISDIAPVNNLAVPRDGVLVLAATAGGERPVGDLAGALAVNVTHAGEPVLGTLENPGVPGVVIWRPMEPLQAGATYDVSGTFHNPADAVEVGCGDASIDMAFAFDAVDVAEPLAAPSVVAEASAELVLAEDLGHLVCCDGAMPSQIDCGGEDAYWSEGACASTRGIGYLQLHVTAESPLPPATAGMLATIVRTDGEEAYRGLDRSFDQRRSGPVCVVVEQLDLASGLTIAAEEQCVGQDLADQLGPKDLDPRDVLADQCQGALYTCELLPDAYPTQWDPEQCEDVAPVVESDGEPTSSSDGDSDSEGSASAGESGESESDDSGGLDDDKQGCGCNSRAADPAGLLGLVVLAALARRRRR